MAIGIDNGVMPRIDYIPIEGKEVILAVETARVAVDVIRQVGNGLLKFVKEIGIFPDVDFEALGGRVLQAIDAGIRPEDYPSIPEWLKVVDGDDWGYDSKLNSHYPDMEKVLMSVGVLAAYVIDIFPKQPMKDFILTAISKPQILEADRLHYFAGLYKRDDDVFNTVIRYIAGSDKSRATIETATDALVEMEKSLAPGIDDNAAYQKVVEYTA